MKMRTQPLVSHVGDEMETLIIEGLRLLAAQAPDLSPKREKASAFADALANDTWLYEAATGPEDHL